MVISDVCPPGKSLQYKNTGHMHTGKQQHQCRDCGRQFVQCVEPCRISDDRRGLIERSLVERIS
jgi:transposase-like protein